MKIQVSVVISDELIQDLIQSEYGVDKIEVFTTDLITKVDFEIKKETMECIINKCKELGLRFPTKEEF